ncbi:hypothetical protein C7K38_05785 [Tetragenococcus osmophilus]|uniref:Uncharacterized protein n=1 Tax=Tetragenococcus osmophilus TaxID=526944 RepID=A0AA38CX41_9ENTE|nr:hypothetical protein [Tetragenococcus osmophilus]AYW47912.1 hypothetical protein C7K38_05785 [Tetragenococcus osmophilus]GMA53616.1 hypothetical protein GCM10025857_49730 [Alicyclobacillus contaminans]GMA72446.1 hypothetical protein GCM10025885_14950 [Tetragenococcus osmophilus]
MRRNIVENQDEKVIETILRMSVKDDVNEFKDAFKGKYQQDWDKIEHELKDEEPKDGVSAPEKYLEEVFEYHKNKIDE